MKLTKRMLALIMSIIMMIGMLPMTAMATDDEAYEGAEIIASGECGLYVEWKLNSLGTLFLERNGPNGATYDYPIEKNSPFRNDSRIKKIVIMEGVTYLGRMLFRDLSNLTEVVFEEGLQEMEFGVFSGCSSLTELELPASFNEFTTVAPFYESGIKKLTFKGNNLNTNTESGYAWDRFLSNVDIYVPLPFTLNGAKLSTYEEAEQALAHNGNRVYCVNDNATIKWKDYDGTVLETDENAAQGVIPTFDGETPSRAYDNANAYYFTGWTPEPREVTGDMVYTATYGSYGKASYIDENGEEQEVFARPLTGTETELPGGWYVVNQDITYSNELKITGEASIILADGATLNIESGYILNVDETKPLNIYCQKDKSGVLSTTTIVAGSVNMYGGNLNVSFMLAAKNVVNIFDGNVNAGYIWAIENGGKIKILGGSVNVEIQLAAKENITLGYKNPTDSIYIKNFDDTAPAITIADGQTFANKDDLSQHYTGTVTAADLKDKKLVPYAHNTITYARSLDGTVTGVSEADYGDEITLTVTPDEGYALNELTVTTEDNKNIEVVDNKFIMPATAVTVSATFISTKRYTVKWVVDGEVVETDENLRFGATPEYNGATPSRDYTDSVHYVFNGWSPAVSAISGDTTYTATFSSASHNWNDGEITTEPTCTAAGEKTYTCTVCGDTYTEDIAIDADAHSCNSEWFKDDNMHWHECALCGERTDEDLHDWFIDFDSYSRPATYFEDGEEHFICTVCGARKTEIIPCRAKPLEQKSGSCGSNASYVLDDDGNLTITGTGPINSSVFTGATNIKTVTIGEGITQTYAFAFEGCLNLETVYLPDSMTWLEVDTFRECISLKTVYIGKGMNEIWSCAFDYCESLTDVYYSKSAQDFNNIAINNYGNNALTEATLHPYTYTHVHTYTEEITTAPTCTEQGYTTYICSECGSSYAGDYVDATGHSYGEPVWTWNGYEAATATFSCTNCTDEQTINATVEKQADGKTYKATATFNETEYTDTKETDIPAAEDKYNLTVEENIDVNVLVDIDGHAADGEDVEKIVYTYPDVTSQEKNTVTETVNADGITTDENGYFAKSFTMAIAQANEPIVANVYFTNGTTKEITVSVAAYCKYIIENAEANGYSDKLVNLSYAVLDYGKNAADYFNYEYAAYPEYTLPSYFDAEPEIESNAGIKKGSVVTGIASTQMYILSKATMRLTFKDDLSSVEVVSAKIGEKELAVAKVDNNGKDAVDISGIYATELSKPILLELSDGTKVQYAATDWAKSILNNSTNAKSKALARALYYYSKAANYYFA